MRQRLQTFLLLLLVISTNVARGNDDINTKTLKGTHKKHNILKGQLDDDRIKRSPKGEEINPFLLNRGKRQVKEDNQRIQYGFEHNIPRKMLLSDNDELIQDSPFWGNRGRRDGSSTELIFDPKYHEHPPKYCEHCSDTVLAHTNVKDRRDDFFSPFWSSRGRRDSNEADEISEPFWGNRGRRQDQEPFWGNRGRRTEDSPFWGNRGRREDEPFWGNRGRREDTEPFWGNRGRRQDQEPFWGNRGRRQENEPFWGNRGRREEEPFWGNRGRRKILDSNYNDKKESLKDSILKAITDVQNDIENLSRLKRRSIDPNSFWDNRGRDNKLKFNFNGPTKSRMYVTKFGKYLNTPEPGTLLDSRMYVDEPNYVLVERSSRASAEDDPYYISRGKKYYYDDRSRDRRGAIEEIVKSVRNDPYNIARGKKSSNIKTGNSNITQGEYTKAKELICSAIDLVMVKTDSGVAKREINYNDRDRRTILKKLAARLQMDPYFVSRGKKSEILRDQDFMQEFIRSVAEKCN